ncbi:MAG: hypothetical protein IPP33_06110 [Flavobacteriales bacterium]|nr:hypothetical protein [Flavobacteriales bacterium]
MTQVSKAFQRSLFPPADMELGKQPLGGPDYIENPNTTSMSAHMAVVLSGTESPAGIKFHSKWNGCCGRCTYVDAEPLRIRRAWFGLNCVKRAT